MAVSFHDGVNQTKPSTRLSPILSHNSQQAGIYLTILAMMGTYCLCRCKCDFRAIEATTPRAIEATTPPPPV